MSIDPQRISGLLAQTRDEDPATCPPLPRVQATPNQPAAVLIPILFDQDEWKILFIKRTQQEDDRHSGQIAFPGGRLDKEDPSLQHTALRESAEEIGLDPASVEILGQCCSMITVTGYEITPFAGILSWPQPLNLSPEEVGKTLLIPVNWLVNPSNHRTELWRSSANPDSELPVIFFNEFEGEVLWGATAQILVDFLELTQLAPEK
jgi:8-oxo-dGTP pyrophosphatase MutT (NUDIX family)